MNRRRFLCTTAALVGLGWTPSVAANPVGMPAIEAFSDWLAALTPADGSGLMPYAHTVADIRSSNGSSPQWLDSAIGKRPPLSLIASADALLFYLKTGQSDNAKKVADGIVHWNRMLRSNQSRQTQGGMPSEIVWDGNAWVSGHYFYSADNLVIIEALLQAYALSGRNAYAETALNIGRWLRFSLFDGAKMGVWKKNFGPPMNYMLANGAVDNSIHTATEYLWIGALRSLHKIESTAGWDEMFKQALKFYADAQSPAGPWFDYFKPHKYSHSTGSWYWYQNRDIVIGDNTLRAALAAQQYGYVQQVTKFLKWLKPANGVFLWGYIDPSICKPQYLPQDKPYFDIVCTGLMRNLYTLRGNQELATLCTKRLLQLQAANGGWYWGHLSHSMEPINADQAVITGIWSLVDLVP
jgi:hypothetical protein